MRSPHHRLAQLSLFLALSLSAVTNEAQLSDEPGIGSREVQFYAHTFRVATPTAFINGTVLAVYDHLGRAVGHTREGWLFSGEGENDLVGTFRAMLPGPGPYSFAINADDGQTYWTDLLRATETDGVLHLWPDRIPLESFPHPVAPLLSSDGRLPAPPGLAANAASRTAPKLNALRNDPRKSGGARVGAQPTGSQVRARLTAKAGRSSVGAAVQAAPQDAPDPFDLDEDGLTDEEEEEAGSDPTLFDTDGDGVGDGEDAVPYDSDLTHPRISVSRYAVIDLGRGTAQFINEAGQVVVEEGATTRLWSNGQNTILPGNADPAGLANNGTVLGTLEVEDEPLRAFTWSPGQTQLQILPVPSGSAEDHTYAQFMTPSGEIFGKTADLDFLNWEGLRWSGGGVSRFGWSTGYCDGEIVVSYGESFEEYKDHLEPIAINDSGTLLMYHSRTWSEFLYEDEGEEPSSYYACPVLIAWSYRVDGEALESGTGGGGGGRPRPSALNDMTPQLAAGFGNGTAWIWVRTDEGWRRKALVATPRTSEIWRHRPGAINDRGQVIATDGRTSENLWQNGRVYTLSALVPAPEWSGVLAEDINDSGMIVGTAHHYVPPSEQNPEGTDESRAVLLVPFEVVPNPIPVTGTARAKIIHRFDADISNLSIKIGGQSAYDIRQDDNDPHIIYFTPPPAPNDEAGEYDLEISGMIGNWPTTQDGIFMLEKYINYVEDVADGVRAFSKSNLVSIEEADSRLRYARAHEGMSEQEAAAEFTVFRDIHSASESALFKAFVADREVSEEEFTGLWSASDRLIARLEGVYAAPPVFTATPSLQRGVTIRRVADAVEGGVVGSFRVSRPDATELSLVVRYGIEGSAENGVDYQELSGEVTIAPEESFAEISIVAHEDDDSGDETVTLTILEDDAYVVDYFDRASVSIQGNSAFGQSRKLPNRIRFQRNEAADDEEVPLPVFGTPSFFPDARVVLQQTSKKVLIGGARYQYDAPFGLSDPIYYMVFDANELQLRTHVVSEAGKTLEDAVNTNRDAFIIINGAQFGFQMQHALLEVMGRDPRAEPMQTIGQVISGGQVQHPTSSTEQKASWATAIKRFWFGQAVDRSPAANGTSAASYLFGGKGNPPAGTVHDGVGGLVSLIVNGQPQTAAQDADLGIYEPFHYGRRGIPSLGGYVGFNVVGVDRQTGLVIIVTKQNKHLFTIFTVQQALHDMGVDEALVTDGGGSTACWTKEFGYISESERHLGTPADRNTVTNYLIFFSTP